MEPEVGQVIDGYRFKGGDPAQESSWEQVEPIDVSSQYGAGARQLPNGVIERVGPRGGVTRIGEANGGNQSGATALVGADARARFMLGLESLVSAQNNLNRMDAAGYNPSGGRNTAAAALEAIPFDGGYVARQAGGDDYNAYQQSVKTFEAAILPIMSGAAVTPSEAQRQVRATLPQPGDSPEVLRRKSYQREQMINAVAEGIGRERPFASQEELVGPTGPSGLPTYPTIMETAQGITEIPQGQAVEGRNADSAIDITSWPAERIMQLPPGVWIKVGDQEPFPLAATPFAGKPAEGSIEGAPGIFIPPEQPISERTDPLSVGIRNVAAFGQGAAEQIPFMDEAAAYAASRLTGIDYNTARRVQSLQSEDDRRERPLARNLGGITGFGASLAVPLGAAGALPKALQIAPRVAGAGRVANAGRMALNTGRVMAGGAATGALYGAGQGETIDERLGNAAEGGAIGAVAAPVVGAAGNALAQPVSRFIERVVSRPNALATGVDRFARRFKPDTNALAARADELSAMEIQPTFVDLMDEGQRGLTRALATRQTPARQAVRDFAEGRAEGLQDRIATQARRTISPETRAPLELRETIARQGREQAAPLYEQAYAQPVQVSDEIKSLLSTPAGQAAMQRAQRIAANERRPFDPENMDMQTLDYMKRGLDDVVETYRDPTTGRLNLDTEGRAVEGIRQAFRSELDQLNPAYAAARQAYGDSASLAEASGLGEQFLTMEADQFARQAGRLRPGEREVAQAGARRAVERAAGTQGAAPGVAQRLASGREQAMRSQALLGENAPAMQRAMQAEREGLMAARAINPAQGSVTSSAMSDQMQAAGNVAQTLGSALTGNLRGTVGGLARLVRLGYSDKEAEALVQASIDPSRTREVIDMLSQRMNRQEARNLVRSLRYMAGQQSGNNAAGNDR